jgi:hypothetical protein
LHGLFYLQAFGIVTNTTDKIRHLAKCLQMPRDVKRRSAQDSLAIRKVIE